MKYHAFISYSHRDRKWGDWLHKALETYKVPRSLVGQPTQRDIVVPERLYPVFRDREELPTASDLGTVINQALKDSRYLIVICSPRATQSNWVNEEILQFKRLGKENRILALIVDGEPNAKERGLPELECFPEAMKHPIRHDGVLDKNCRTEPIAADAREDADGRENALLKIVAGILAVDFNVLKRRDAIRRKQLQRRILIISTALMFIFACIATVALWQWREAEAQTYIAQSNLVDNLRKQGIELMHRGQYVAAKELFYEALAIGGSDEDRLRLGWAESVLKGLIGFTDLGSGLNRLAFAVEDAIAVNAVTDDNTAYELTFSVPGHNPSGTGEIGVKASPRGHAWIKRSWQPQEARDYVQVYVAGNSSEPIWKVVWPKNQSRAELYTVTDCGTVFAASLPQQSGYSSSVGIWRRGAGDQPIHRIPAPSVPFSSGADLYLSKTGDYAFVQERHDGYYRVRVFDLREDELSDFSIELPAPVASLDTHDDILILTLRDALVLGVSLNQRQVLFKQPWDGPVNETRHVYHRPSQQLAVNVGHGTVRLINLDGSLKESLWRLPVTGILGAMAFSGDGSYLLIAMREGDFHLRNLDSEVVLSGKWEESELSASALNSDGSKLALGDKSGRVSFWKSREIDHVSGIPIIGEPSLFRKTLHQQTIDHRPEQVLDWVFDAKTASLVVLTSSGAYKYDHSDGVVEVPVKMEERNNPQLIAAGGGLYRVTGSHWAPRTFEKIQVFQPPVEWRGQLKSLHRIKTVIGLNTGKDKGLFAAIVNGFPNNTLSVFSAGGNQLGDSIIFESGEESALYPIDGERFVWIRGGYFQVLRGDDKGIRLLYEIETGVSNLFSIKPHAHEPISDRLYLSTDSKMLIVDLNNGSLLSSIPIDRIRGVNVLAADETYIAVTRAPNELLLMDLDGAMLQHLIARNPLSDKSELLRSNRDVIGRHVIFDSQRQVIGAGFGRRVQLWDLETGQTLWQTQKLSASNWSEDCCVEAVGFTHAPWGVIVAENMGTFGNTAIIHVKLP